MENSVADTFSTAFFAMDILIRTGMGVNGGMMMLDKVMRGVATIAPRTLVFMGAKILFTLKPSLPRGIRLVDRARSRGQDAYARHICIKCRTMLAANPRHVHRRRYEFDLQRRLFDFGLNDVTDPLFHCTPIATDVERIDPNRSTFSTRFHSGGLIISGEVSRRSATDTPRAVRVLVNGITLRTISLDYSGDVAKFSVSIKRPVLATFPKRVQLQVETIGRQSCFSIGRIEVVIPHGTGGLPREVECRGELDKKGRFKSLPSEIDQQHTGFLALYDSVREVLEHRNQTPLLLMYGTLLGQHREGDFIPWDDDFDVGYFSNETRPELVKDEVKRIVSVLVSAGFDIVIGKGLRMPVWVRSRNGTAGEHLSLRPIWHQDGFVWSEIKARLRLRPIDFAAQEGRLRGVKVYKPQNTDAFLAEYYGADWRKPDPGYSNASRIVPDSVYRNLARTAFTMQDVESMREAARRMRADDPKCGHILCSNLDGLYPLEDYERVYGW